MTIFRLAPVLLLAVDCVAWSVALLALARGGG
jgi:hypothetical protein